MNLKIFIDQVKVKFLLNSYSDNVRKRAIT